VGGEEFYSATGLTFPEGYNKPDKRGKTFFGWSIHFPAVIYARSDVNMSCALTRQTNKRKPLQLGYDEMLTENQLKLSQNTLLWEELRKLRDKITEKARDVGDYLDLLKEYVHQPHPKIKERLQALEKVILDSRLYHETFVVEVLGKIKIEELAKPGKYPRLFTSLGSTSILKAGFLIDIVKECMRHTPGFLEMDFIKSPDYDDLSRVFANLINPTNGYFCFFSDDSSVALQTADEGVWRSNLDISSCDGSHTKFIFDVLRFLCGGESRFKEAIGALVSQLLKNLVIKSYTGFKERKVVLKPLFPCLYTGTTGTTIINNIANWLIGKCLELVLKGQRPKFSECRQLILKVAEDCGYILTVDECHFVEQLQFLKHSPVWTGEQFVPILNIGVILRIFGSCWGDLPYNKKRDTFEGAAYTWNRCLTQSLVHAGNHILTDMLRSKYSTNKDSSKVEIMRKVIKQQFEYRLGATGREIPVALTQSICQRYGVLVEEFESLVSLIKDADDGKGTIIDLPVSRVILSKDYSYDDW